MPSSPVVERPLIAPRTGSPARGRSSRRASAPSAAALLLCAASSLVACGGGPAPRLYVLEPPGERGAAVPGIAPGIAPDVSPDVSSAGAIGPLGTAVVTLPGYARDPRIASRDAGIGVSLDDDDRWAEAPEEAITRVLIDRLRYHGGESVLLEPLPRGFEPVARVEIVFDRLLRTPAGGVDTSGRILLLSGEGRDVVDVLVFRLERAAASSEPAAFFDAVAGAVDELARTALDRLRGVRAPG